MESPIINLQSSTFTFSQASLQAYSDCPRRFQLRYLQRLAWPAPEAQPAKEYEEHLQRGRAFHRLIQQYFLGIQPGRLSQSATADPLLAEWWRNFQVENPVPDDYAKYTEASLAIPVGEHRLVARYDTLAVGNGELIIFDWKTNKNLPKRDWLMDRFQTRVYSYVLTRAGDQLTQGKEIQPDQVEIVYWFSNFPATPMRFTYSQEQFETDGDFLSSLVEQITGLGEDDFTRTEDLHHCRYCSFRSLCDRGIEAGNLDDLETVYDLDEGPMEVQEIEIDIDQIAEIEF